MKKLFIAAACLTMMSGAAVAQGNQPVGTNGSAPNNVAAPSPSSSSNDMSKSGMNSGTAGTTGTEGKGTVGMSHSGTSSSPSIEKGRMDKGETRK